MKSLTLNSECGKYEIKKNYYANNRFEYPEYNDDFKKWQQQKNIEIR